jgi:hypothetical protein
MIDPKLFTVGSILAAMFDDVGGNVDAWRKYAEIVPDYMPPYPREDTKPACVVKLGGSFLRRGGSHYFWDMYGDDFGDPAWALLALLNAPIPPWAIKREAFDGSMFKKSTGG